MTMTAAFSRFAGNGGKDQYFTLKLKTTDLYWPEMIISVAVPNHMEFKGYKDNIVASAGF